MHGGRLAASLLVAFVSNVARPEPVAPLTVARIVQRSPSLFGTSPSAAAWSPDSKRLAFLWNDQGVPDRQLWLVDREGTAPRRLTPLGAPVSEFVWSSGDALLYLSGGNVHRIGAGGGEAQALTTDPADRSGLAVAPDGRTASFLQDGDLWFLPLGGGPAVRATHVAVKPIGQVAQGTYFHRDVEKLLAHFDRWLAPGGHQAKR